VKGIAMNLGVELLKKKYSKKFPPARAGQALLLKEGCPDVHSQGGVVDSFFSFYLYIYERQKPLQQKRP
jgi:hypothetical protein